MRNDFFAGIGACTLACLLAAGGLREVTAQTRDATNAARTQRVQVPATELRESARLQPVARLAATAPVRVARAAAADPVAAQRQRIERMRAQIRVPATRVTPVQLPGVHRLNGQDSGVFEPGGRYLLEGGGFGERSGRVTLRGDGLPPVDLAVTSWAPGHILVDVPAGISGAPDLQRAELTVASPTARPLVSRRFGFRAAREEVPVPRLPREALVMDRGFFGDEASADMQLGGAHGTFSVQRVTRDPDRSGCHDGANDRVLVDRLPLAPGFEISAASWTHDQLRNRETGQTHETGFGRYELRWSGPHLLDIRSGAQRVYFKKSLSAAAVISWLATMGWYDASPPGHAVCTSRYVATLYATGPRGVSPVR